MAMPVGFKMCVLSGDDINTSATPAQSSSDWEHVCYQQSSFFSELAAGGCAVKGVGRAWPTKSEDMHVELGYFQHHIKDFSQIAR